MEGRMVVELVEEVGGDGGECGRPRREARLFWACWFRSQETKEEERMDNERERRSGGIYKR